jgi:hypothetical protein
MPKIIQKTYCLFIALFFMSTCYVNACETVPKSPKVNETSLTWQYATIQHFSFEGGFYGIVTKKGEKLLPLNLPTDYQKPGIKVKLKGQLIPEMMTMNQWGSPFHIIEILSVDK